jgi:hypothetical protein
VPKGGQNGEGCPKYFSLFSQAIERQGFNIFFPLSAASKNAWEGIRFPSFFEEVFP